MKYYRAPLKEEIGDTTLRWMSGPFVRVTEPLLSRAEWEATRGWSEGQAIKAADAFNAEMIRITGKSSAVEMRAIYAALNAVGEDTP